MRSLVFAVCAAAALAGCDGNPFLDEDGVIELPPGTENPSRSNPVFRREPTSTKEGEGGNGYVTGVEYNDDDDTFEVDGLAFDGSNVYDRGTSVGDLGPFQVYEADSTYADSVTGAVIDQDLYRAIYGVSSSGGTEFAIVRTGAYVDFGFGGFVYQRNGSVTLPSSGFAQFTGDYAALRDFKGQSGLEYATGTMSIDIDFNDFNDGAGVAGTVSGRQIFDTAGNNITPSVIAALNLKNSTAVTALPTLNFAVGPGVLNAAGEIAGSLSSYQQVSSGANTLFETGKYYAVISGNATTGVDNEIVGVIVVQGQDPRLDGVTFRETGGFILYR